eukprot:5214797-Amphidinium_carterae.1
MQSSASAAEGSQTRGGAGPPPPPLKEAKTKSFAKAKPCPPSPSSEVKTIADADANILLMKRDWSRMQSEVDRLKLSIEHDEALAWAKSSKDWEDACAHTYIDLQPLHPYP